jgi:hypothetical protein
MAARITIIAFVVGVVFKLTLFYMSTLENSGLVMKKIVPFIYLDIIDTQIEVGHVRHTYDRL